MTNNEILGIREKLAEMAFRGSQTAAKLLRGIESQLAMWCDTLTPDAWTKYATALSTAEKWLEQSRVKR